MPTTEPPYAALSHRQNGFAMSYIRAVISVAGCSLAVPEPDIDKVDIVAMSRRKGKVFSKPSIFIQAKCRLGGVPAGTGHIPYQLDIETYDNLRDPTVTNPRILVVVFVPQLLDDWMLQDDAQLALKHCGYWVSLLHAPDVVGQGSRVVHLPRANRFTPHALQAMMTLVSDGGTLLDPLPLEEALA